MKVLSIRQPWAALILADRPGWKNIENRKWPTRYRGWMYIHAAKTPATRADFDHAREMAKAARLHFPVDGFELHYGGIIGMVRVLDCVIKHKSPWAVGPWCWVLGSPYPLPFERCAGQLGLYDYGSLPKF